MCLRPTEATENGVPHFSPLLREVGIFDRAKSKWSRRLSRARLALALSSYIDFRRLAAQLQSGAPQAPVASRAPNKTMASMLLRPSRDQYTSLRFSQSANSSSVSAAPTP